MKYLPGARLRVLVVGEADQHVGALVDKAQHLVLRHPLELTLGVALRLLFGGGEPFALASFLRFNDTHRGAVNKQHVVGGAGVGRIFPNGYSQAGRGVQAFHILHGPSGGS